MLGYEIIVVELLPGFVLVTLAGFVKMHRQENNRLQYTEAQSFTIFTVEATL